MKNLNKLKTKLFSTAFFMLLTTTCIGQWNQLGIDIDGEAANDNSGESVSMSADGLTVAIGAKGNANGNGFSAGHVRIYQWSGSSWMQQGADIDGEATSDQSGFSVSMSADGATVAIGAKGNDGNGSDAGHVRIYQWNGASWMQQGADIDGEAAGDQSGASVSMSADGSTVAIGAIVNGAGAGHVRIYQWNGASWIQQGADIDGEGASDQSGWSVSMSDDGSAVAIGSWANDDNGVNAGHVRIYQWNGSSWIQQGADIDGEAAYDLSGESVCMSADGSTVAIGASRNDGNGTDAGHVRIYQWNGASWMQQGADIDGEAADDQSGRSVTMSADGTTVAIGANGSDGNGFNAGHVRIYQWNGSSWIQQGADIDGEAASDGSGRSVSMSADGATVAIGANGNTVNGFNTGHVRVYSFSCIAVPSTDTEVACDSYTWIDGNTYTATNNTATWTLTNLAGCDSIITLDLTINSLPDNNVTQAGSLLTSDQTGATYQWLDCDDNNSIINGETNQSYTSAVIGNYSVEVTLNGCIDTSACMLVDFTGLYEINNSAIKVYPNPTKGLFNIEVDARIVGANYIIFDQLGKILQSGVISSPSQILNVSELSKGVYNLMIDNSDIRVKLIKE